MSNRVGSSTIYSTTLPNNQAFARIHSVNLSKAAKHRLQIIEHYLHKTRNVSLTCRHYAISRSYFYKWLKRYNPKNLASLENQSRRPRHVRAPCYTTDQVNLIRRLRKQRPTYSAKKLHHVLKRDEGLAISAATIGRIIKRFKLYFRAVVAATKQRSARARQVWKQRKPYNLKATGPRQLIEFDMKHVYAAGQRLYAFVAIDVFSKQLTIHVASSPSSYQARQALQRVVEIFGTDIRILNDNGSENLKHAYQYLKDQDITQYFARPHTPKDKPHVENVIGKLQQECLDEDRSRKTTLQLQNQINRWVNDYHFYRPHQALDYQTPEEFCATMSITIPRAGVSTM